MVSRQRQQKLMKQLLGSFLYYARAVGVSSVTTQQALNTAAGE